MHACSLEIKDLIVYVRLGCLAEERKLPQEVSVNLRFFFQKPPKACISDELDNETICYADVSKKIQNFIREREFNLIEHLCFEIFKLIKPLLNQNIKLEVEVIKLKPPIPHLHGGTRFTYHEL